MKCKGHRLVHNKEGLDQKKNKRRITTTITIISSDIDKEKEAAEVEVSGRPNPENTGYLYPELARHQAPLEDADVRPPAGIPRLRRVPEQTLASKSG